MEWAESAPLPAREIRRFKLKGEDIEGEGEGVTGKNKEEVYHRESYLAISSSPVTNNNVQFIYWVYCYRVKNLKNSSSVPGLSVMTLRDCRVDRPFPVT